jgi:hypothetical protein
MQPSFAGFPLGVQAGTMDNTFDHHAERKLELELHHGQRRQPRHRRVAFFNAMNSGPRLFQHPQLHQRRR